MKPSDLGLQSFALIFYKIPQKFIRVYCLRIVLHKFKER